MTDASEKLEELDTAVKKTLLFNEAEVRRMHEKIFGDFRQTLKAQLASFPLDPSFSTSWMNYLGRLGNYAKEADRAENHAEYHQVMSQASKNLRTYGG